MVNVILASLVSVCLGFLAGSIFSRRNEAPLSKKEAVTGDVEGPAKTYAIPRPLSGREEVEAAKNRAGTDTPKTSAATPTPKMCEPGSTLQEQLQRLKFLELRKLCDDAEQAWIAANIDSRYKFSEDSKERQNADFALSLKNLAKISTHWRGTSTVTVGETTIEVETLLDVYGSKDPSPSANQRLAINSTWSPGENPCYVLEPFYTVNGKVQGLGSISSCDGALPKKGDVDYFRWHTYGDKDIAPSVSVFMYPLPPSSAGLDYLASPTGQWLTASDFRWVQSTEAEFNSLRVRYAKKLEQQGR